MPELIIQGVYYCRLDGVWHKSQGIRLVKVIDEISQMLDNAWYKEGQAN